MRPIGIGGVVTHSPCHTLYMRVRIRRFDRLIPPIKDGLGIRGRGRRVGFTSRASILCGFAAPCLPEARRNGMARAIPSSRPKHY